MSSYNPKLQKAIEMAYNPRQRFALDILAQRVEDAKKRLAAPRKIIDFETRCDLDIKKVGGYKYSQHPSCEALMMSYNLTGKPGDTKLWQMGDKPPMGLFTMLQGGAMLGAFNSYFEYCIWQNVCVPKLGWPSLEIEDIIDVADKCKALALPANLAEAGEVLQLDMPKDERGKALINLFCKPRKDGTYNDKYSHPVEWQEFCEYAIRDTDAELEIDIMLPDLNPLEQLTAWLTNRMNWRGIYIDQGAVRAADKLADQVKEQYNKEAAKLSGGAFLKCTQRAKVKAWFAEQGLVMPNMQGKTVTKWLRKDLKPHVRRMLELYTVAGSSSVAKFSSMLNYVCADGRVHELLNYHKARCVPGDTEVLTEEGWQRIDQWKSGNIAQWHKDTGEIEFLHADRYVGGVESEWVQVKNNYMDVQMTLGHGTYMATHDGGPANWRDGQAGDLLTTKGRRYSKCSGVFKGRKSYHTDDEIRLMAAIQADGHFAIQVRGKALRFGFEKPRKAERMRELLKGCGLKYTETFEPTTQRANFYIPAAPWMQRAKHYGAWLLGLDNEQREVLLSELIHWDGSEKDGTWRYTTSIEANATWIQTIAHLNGKRCSISRDPNGYHSELYTVNMLKRAQDYFTIEPSKGHITSVTKSQQTYCTHSKTGYWLARANGKVFISNNTGRWGGKGIQIQNFPRPVLPKGTDYEDVLRMLKKGSVAELEAYARKLEAMDKKNRTAKGKTTWWTFNVMQILTSSIRSVLCAMIGSHFKSADYSAIEARFLVWEAGDERALQLFREGKDVYLDMAAEIYGVPFETLDKESDERPLGKETILGAGYGMGHEKFQTRCDEVANIQIDVAMAKKSINAYRNKYKSVAGPKGLWKQLERAANEAVMYPGRVTEYRGFKYRMAKYGKMPILECRFPSGRKTGYPFPRVVEIDKWGNGNMMHELRYQGYDSKTHKWVELSTYGGKLTENNTQGGSRDLMAFGMLLLDCVGYFLIMTVHDEAASEDEDGFGSLEDFEMLLCTLPKWAAGLPVTSEGWQGPRYRK